MAPKLDTLATFAIASGDEIRLRRDGDSLDLRRFDHFGPGHTPCATRDGLRIPVAMIDDLVRALKAAADG